MSFAVLLALVAPALADDAPASAAAPPAEEAPRGVVVGEPAPDFTLPDLDGRQVTLSDHRGKVVVLEWFNPGCPFVVHAHEEGGPLRDMAATWAEEDVVWLAVNSGAPGKQGHGVEVNREAAEAWGMAHPVLLDVSGDVGRRYGATNTPHMYVIDADGVLRYQGALDNAPFGKPQGGALTPWARDAIAAVTSGKPAQPGSTKAYGCSVKY